MADTQLLITFSGKVANASFLALILQIAFRLKDGSDPPN